MRRFVVALIAVSIALTLVGCSGSKAPAETAAPAAAPAAAVPAPAAPAEAPAPASLGLSENIPDTFEVFPTVPGIPKALGDDIKSKQPTLIYFFDGTQSASKENRKIIDSVTASNRGLVDLFTFDLGKHFSNLADVAPVPDDEFTTDRGYQAAVELARQLGVTNTPFIVITDNQGYVTWKFRGFTDKATLERQVLRASN